MLLYKLIVKLIGTSYGQDTFKLNNYYSIFDLQICFK